jgi:hypothetical protein
VVVVVGIRGVAWWGGRNKVAADAVVVVVGVEGDNT